MKIFGPAINDKVFLAQGENSVPVPNVSSFHVFETPDLEYFPYCDDFGPLNMSCVVRFIERIDLEIAAFPDQRILFFAKPGKRMLTNALFLLGSYNIIKLDFRLQDVLNKFSWIDFASIQPYRDATFSAPDFGLRLEDCWSGLVQGKCLGWIAVPTSETTLYGQLNIEEYEQYDDPLNGDLHEVVPGKFVAFKGPKDLSGREYLDERNGNRQFSPEYYLSIFRELNVVTVVRLNEPEYDAQAAFNRFGIRTVALEFEDCTSPPNAVVSAFLAAADSAHAGGGSVAVHCRAGLGRTGTLIALWLMRRLGFSAREAMGWLRIMRPGSIIGQQQHYLCRVERALRASPVAALQRAPTARGGGGLAIPSTDPGEAPKAAAPAADGPSWSAERPRRLPALTIATAAASAAAAHPSPGKRGVSTSKTPAAGWGAQEYQARTARDEAAVGSPGRMALSGGSFGRNGRPFFPSAEAAGPYPADPAGHVQAAAAAGGGRGRQLGGRSFRVARSSLPARPGATEMAGPREGNGRAVRAVGGGSFLLVGGSAPGPAAAVPAEAGGGAASPAGRGTQTFFSVGAGSTAAELAAQVSAGMACRAAERARRSVVD